MKGPLDLRTPVLSRRHFMGLSGLGVLGYTFRAESASLRESFHGIRYNDPLQPLVFKVRRAWDLLNIEVELINFMPVRQRGFTDTADTPSGTTTNTSSGNSDNFVDRFAFHIASYSRPGYVVLKFGGQHIAEQAIWDRPVIPREDVPARKVNTPFPRYFLTRDEDIPFLRRGRFDKPFDLSDPSTVKPKPGQPGGLAGTWLAGHSQLVFEIPQRYTPLPFDLDELLERCLMFGKLRVHPRLLEEKPIQGFLGSPHESLRLDASYLGQHDITAPYTRIEFPSMLYISPYDNAKWKLRPTSWGNRAELWSLDLERPDPGAAAGRPRELKRKGHLFAFDTDTLPGRWPLKADPDKNVAGKYAKDEAPKTSLYMATRQLLVSQMMEDNGDITAHDFRLTPIGATADLHYKPLLSPRLKNPTKKGGVSTPPKPGDKSAEDLHKPDEDISDKNPGFLTEWIHKTEIGRDYYVKEAFAGWWFPLQLPAESVTITERLFCSHLDPGEVEKEGGDPLLERVADMEGNLVAFLVARKFGIVKERERDFGPPESDDFDEVGSELCRNVGPYRKVEILVNRTPVLSNQPTPDDSKVMERIKNGEDGTFVTGGTGADAGREIFWPRIAIAGDGGKGRQTSVYRFPVRLTFHNGTVKETDMPLLFCYDLNAGCTYYQAAPKELKDVAVNAKVPLAIPQHAGAINGGEISADDQAQMLAVLKEWQSLHPAFEKLIPPVPKGGKSGPQEALATEAAARTVSSLLGGVRETLFDHVSSFRGDLLQHLNQAAPQDLPQEGQFQAWFHAFLVKADPFAAFRNNDDASAMAIGILRTIAWGRDALRGADVSHSAKRLAAFLEQIKSLPEAEAETKAAWFINRITKLEGYPELAARQDDFKKIVDTFKGPFPGKKLDWLEQQMPALQINWAANLGKTWQRRHWDEWFAALFIGLDRANQQSPPWMLVALSLIQKQHLQLLMQGKKPPAPKDSTLKAELLQRAFTPLANINSPEAVFSVSKDLEKTFESFFNTLEDDLASEGTAALSRIKTAVEESLPNEIFLRQKVQHLAEDFNSLVAEGREGVDKIKDEFSRILSDCSLNLCHLAAHADQGKRSVRSFMTSAASSLERVASPLREVESAIEKVIDGKFAKALPKVSEDEILKLVLSSPPAETLGHFKNLLRETGGRLTAEIEDALLGLNDLVLNSTKQLDELRASLDRYLTSDSLIKSSAELTTVAALTRKHRLLREQLLAEISKAIDPWRGMLIKCLRSIENDLKTLKGDELEKAKLKYAALSGLLDRKENRLLSVRLAARATDLLFRVRADVDPASMNEIQQQIFNAEIDIIRRLVKSGTALEGEVTKAIDFLKKYGAPLDAALKAEITALDAAVRKEGALIKDHFWESCDALEQFMQRLLALKRDDLVKTCRALLEKCGAALATGGIADIEQKLENAWKEMTPHIKDLQAKFGQTADWVNNGEAKARIEKQLKRVADDLKDELESRTAFLEGAGRNLIQKGRIALACPSMLKSFRDQSAKAVYHVEGMVMGMAKPVAEAKHLLDDLRTSVGFPQLQNMKVRVPDIDAPQFIKNTAAYVQGGLRGASSQLEGALKGAVKETAGTFAEILGAQANTIARDSGMADAVSNIQMLSRDVGGMARDFKDKVGNLKTEADKVMKDFSAKAEEYKKAGQEILDKARKDIQGQIDSAKGQLEAEAAKFIPDGMGKLFGVLPMKDILAVIGSPDKAPQMLANRLPDRIERNYNWENEITQFSLPGGLLRFDPRTEKGAKSKLKVTNQIILWVPKPGQPVRPPDYSTKGQIGGFSLTLAGMLQLHFKSVCFTARNGKCDFDVKLGKTSPDNGGGGGGGNGGDSNDEAAKGEFMAFLGPLEIIDTIREKLSSFIDGKNGPLISIQDDRIYAGYSFMVPPISFGAMSVENISLSVQLSLPLKSGALTFLFKLCDRMLPFRVSVSGFTGGGYLGVQVSPDRKLCYVEGAAEFGGSLSFNVGVASGEIYLMAGIYFKMEQAGVTFSGYVRAGGSLRVLGFINVSLMFYLALYYQKRNQQTVFRGECTLSIRVSLGFFKKTVRIQMQREFEGSGSQSEEQEPETAYLPSGRSRDIASTALLSRFLLMAVAQLPANEVPANPPKKKKATPVIPTHFEDTFAPKDPKGKYDSTGWTQYWNCFDAAS